MMGINYYQQVQILQYKSGILKKDLLVQDLKHIKIKYMTQDIIIQVKILHHVELEVKYIFGTFKIHQNQ